MFALEDGLFCKSSELWVDLELQKCSVLAQQLLLTTSLQLVALVNIFIRRNCCGLCKGIWFLKMCDQSRARSVCGVLARRHLQG